MEMNNQPLVSVPVITYNSSKFVLETLESIKAQTYQNIELIISDDCSTDNTIELCLQWVEDNKDRFIRTQIITSKVNTGVSANLNRAEAACQGEWVKSIAGDDLLMPNCIADCVEYIQENPEIIYLFGKCKAFDAPEERCMEVDNVFDYSFFTMTSEEQLHRLIFVGNCVPATTVFYNREKAKKIGITNDERIPLLEDWPKWINLLRAGVKLHFLDKVLVKYRIGGISTGKSISLSVYRSGRFFDFYYRFPEWYKKSQDEAIQRIVDEECKMAQWYLSAEKQLFQIRSSHAYRLGKMLLKPFSFLRRLIKG